ncbi:MAG TPA: MraY family glycosyltransferase [Lamprocystis sp. (in: g-proteobacteria)]|nr:MraY family glycosyltransferase [Lamprocystis sp. (in: g-proteobacteria)]
MIAYLTAFLATAALVYLLSPVARHIGLIDIPCGHKVHEGEVPLVGGIAMFCGFLFAILALPISLNELRPLFAGSALLVIIGVLDDFHELGPHTRFVAQISAASLMTLWGGNTLQDLGGLFGPEPTPLGDWAIPFTIFAVVGVINALNMLDGMDGLGGGYALMAFALLAITTLANGAAVSAMVLFTLSAAVGAFLLFNLRLGSRVQALVFMGNSGSLFLGFVLAWFVVGLSQGQQPAIDPVTALWILSIPLLDTVGIMLRRALHRRSPILPDREHLHHLLRALGLSVKRTVTVIIGSGALLAAGGLAAEWAGVPEQVRFGTFLSLFVAYLVAIEITWKQLNGRATPLA